jgi:hypothetical protein
VTEPPPRVVARPVPPPLDPTRSTAVALCPFRLCQWATPDTRTATPEVVDDLIREHLLDAHRSDLARLGRLATDHGLIR